MEKEAVSPTEIWKRRTAARDYFFCVPEERVRLNYFVDGPDERQFRTSIGFEALKCNAVACLAGWLWTMPEYRDWAKAKRLPIDSEYSLCRYLGIDWNMAVGPFVPRRCAESEGTSRHLSDKSIAIKRLDELIAATPH